MAWVRLETPNLTLLTVGRAELVRVGRAPRPEFAGWRYGPDAMPPGVEIRRIGRVAVDATSPFEEARSRGAVRLIPLDDLVWKGGRHHGAHQTRRDGVHRDAGRAELAGERLHEPVHAGLRRGVVRLPELAAQSVDRAHCHDPAAAS